MPPRAVAREFRIGDEIPGPISTWPREIMVVFDTAGNAAVITDEVHKYTRSGLFSGMESAMVMLPPLVPRNMGKYMRADVDTMKLRESIAQADLETAMRSQPKPDTRDMTDEEYAKAKALGSWLWDHRCFK